MPEGAARSRGRHRWMLLLEVLGLALPALAIQGWMLWSGSTIGNDYRHYQVTESLGYRVYHRVGIEPMWNPLWTGGIPQSGDTFAQAFHLPAYLMSLWPAYWNGDAVVLFAAKHLLLAILGHALAYVVLLKAGLGRTWGYLLAFVSIYNLRALDCLRYGGAFDALVYGQSALLFAMLYLVTGRRPLLLVVLALVQLLLTSGYYPALPHLALATVCCGVIFLVARPVPPGQWTRRGAWAAAAAAGGVLLAAPNWFPFLDFLSVNSARMEAPTLEWASHLAATWPAILLNFFEPWRAESHSAFGGSALTGLLAGSAIAVSFTRFPRRIVLLPLLALPFLLSLGASNPVYTVFFRWFPGFRVIRVPGRVFLVLPIVVMAVALVWAASRARDRQGEAGLRVAARISALLNLAVIGWVLVAHLVGGSVGWLPAVHFEFSPERFYPETWTEAFRLGWLGLGILACACFYAVARSGAPAWRVALLLLTMAQTWMVVRHGTWVEPRSASATAESLLARDLLPVYPYQSTNPGGDRSHGTATVPFVEFLKAAGDEANCYLPLNSDQASQGVTVPLYLTDRVRVVLHPAHALAALGRQRCASGAAVWTYVQSTTASYPGAGVVTDAGLAALNEGNRLLALTPNLVKLRVEAARPAVLVTHYPRATSNWKGSLDGHEVPLVTVDGAFVGMEIPAGTHVARIWYLSRRHLLGLRVFFFAAALLVAALLWTVVPVSPRYRLVLLLVVAGLAIAADRAAEIRTVRMAGREALFCHSYRHQLRAQIARWVGVRS